MSLTSSVCTDPSEPRPLTQVLDTNAMPTCCLFKVILDQSWHTIVCRPRCKLISPCVLSHRVLYFTYLLVTINIYTIDSKLEHVAPTDTH